MKLFNAQQIYAADKSTIANQQIKSDELMERAAVQLFNWLHLRLQGASVKIHLFCGIGNNGGDGVALARHLQDHGYNIGVFVVNYSKTRSKDFLINLERLKERKVWPVFLEEGSTFPEVGRDDIIVDAIFGIGLNRPPAPWVVDLMRHLHKSEALVLSVDIPSGLYMNDVPKNEDAVVKANYVLSFQAPKLVFFLPETGIYMEHWEVLDIGLDQNFLSQLETEYRLIGKNEVLSHYLPREKFAHKGTYGHSLIIGGSYGKIGAVVLSAKAALHSGSGLVTAYVPECGYTIMQTALPEAMVVVDADEKNISHIDFDLSPKVIGLGVGLGKEATTVKALSDFLSKNKTPLVIDADALNILSENQMLLEKLSSKTVLTPHPKELERLIGKWENDFDKLKKTKEFSKKYDCIVIIKGAHTITLYGEKGYVNTTGNPGMATAGSGDVLTGIITGLIAQGYGPLEAAIFGVYLHGKAGDLTVGDTGYQALTATGIVEGIGAAYLDLFKTPDEPQEQNEHSEQQQ